MNPGPFWRSLADFFFPPQCPLCGGVPGDSQHPERPCPLCFSRIPFSLSPRCPRCGVPFASPSETDHLCSECLTQERYFSRARSVCRYEGLIAEAISHFKYGGAIRLAPTLGTFLADYQDSQFPFSGLDLILPVPLHPGRLRERGFNQSLLLARCVSRRHSIPLNFTALQRIRPTPPQTRLSGPERQGNVRGAFEVRNASLLAGKRVLLIDDVFTTGATARECARVLLEGGGREVNVLTLARAV